MTAARQLRRAAVMLVSGRRDWRRPRIGRRNGPHSAAEIAVAANGINGSLRPSARRRTRTWRKWTFENWRVG